MATSTKANGSSALDMDRVAIISRSETHTSANTNMAKPKASASTCGATETSTRANSSMARRMDRVIGKKVATRIVTSTRADTRMTKSMVTVSLLGNQAVNTKETMQTTSRSATVKCTGTMAQFTEDTGKRDCSMALGL